MEVPDDFKGKKVEVIISPVYAPLERKEKRKKYDFWDVSGKIKWSGDAVHELRKLRDE